MTHSKNKGAHTRAAAVPSPVTASLTYPDKKRNYMCVTRDMSRPCVYVCVCVCLLGGLRRGGGRSGAEGLLLLLLVVVGGVPVSSLKRGS